MAGPTLRLGKLLAFYTIFYSVLAALCALSYKIFATTLDDHEPKWQLDQSIIGSTPGLTFKPRRGLVEYTPGDPSFVQAWISELDKFLEPYVQAYKHENVQSCASSQPPETGRVCDYRIVASQFAPCLPQYGYGLDFDGSDKGPCIFLKLNKVFGWRPEFYDRDTVPSEMPESLVEIVKNAELRNEQDKVWVDCVGLNLTDVGNVGPIRYYPQQGFDGKYFPFTNIEGYLSPLVAVHFERPRRGVLINVECRAWAVNIRQDSKYSKGAFSLNLFVR